MKLVVTPGSFSRVHAPEQRGRGYRPDIDGLRAVAVLAVIAFHTGLPFIEGGFVGVDIFFVISGYLISGILMREMGSGSFTYRNFYARRARRILPALFATLIATAIASAVVLIPSGFEAFGKSTIAAVLSSANFYLWSESTYFGVGAAQMPLLHTWSLAIEEQFYLLLPPYLLVMKRVFGARWLSFLVPVALLSFVACVLGTERAPSAAFYFPFTRAWELALGGIVAALPRFRAMERRLPAELLAAVGASMVLASIFLFDERMSFPGAAALLPSLGSALLISANGSAPTLTGTLLKSRPLVFTGLLSYSLYLWHWPILVLSRTAFTGPPSPIQSAVLLGVMLGAGYLSWRFVETPFRHPSPGSVPARFYWGCAALASVLVVFGASAWLTTGAPGRFSESLRRVALSSEDTNPHRGQCDKPSLERTKSGAVCHLGSDGARARVALVGDSFADALSPALEEAARQAGSSVGIYSRSGCQPLLLDRSDDERDSPCGRFAEAAIEAVARDQELETVVFFLSWPTLVMGWRYTVNLQKIDFLTDRFTSVPGEDDALRALELALSRTFDRLEGKKLVVVAHWPEQKIFVPQTVTTRAALGLAPPLGITHSELEMRENALRALFARLARARTFDLIDLSRETCKEGHCAVVRDGGSLYVDYNHISRSAAVQMAPRFASLF